MNIWHVLALSTTEVFIHCKVKFAINFIQAEVQLNVFADPSIRVSQDASYTCISMTFGLCYKLLFPQLRGGVV